LPNFNKNKLIDEIIIIIKLKLTKHKK